MEKKKTYKRNKFFLIGIIIYLIAIAGYLTAVVYSSLTSNNFDIVAGIFLIVYSAFLIGLILIFISGRPVLIKILLTLIWIILIIAVRFIYIQTHLNVPETFLISKDFRGIVHVYYDMPCGSEPEYESGRRIYKIPDNGILFLKTISEYGYPDQEYYLTDESGKRMQLPLIMIWDSSNIYITEAIKPWKFNKKVKSIPVDTLAIFNIHNGSKTGGYSYTNNYGYKEVDGERIYTKISTEKNIEDIYKYNYFGFYVTTYTQFKNIYNYQYPEHLDLFNRDLDPAVRYLDSLRNHMDSLEMKFINDCLN